MVRVQVPPADSAAVPREVAPSKTSTVLLASAVPDKTTVAVFWSALSAGAVIAGAAGAAVSTRTRLVAGGRLVKSAGAAAREGEVCLSTATLESDSVDVKLSG